MTATNCIIYHKFLKALGYKEGHHAQLNQRLQIYPIKHLILQVKDWRQMICKFSVVFTEADADMNHQVGSLIDCS